MNALRRLGALLEVLGIVIAGQLVTRLVIHLLNLHVTNPLKTFSVGITDAELITATWDMFVLFGLQYVGYFALIIPINWWHRRRGPAAYGLTKANRSWSALFSAGIATISLASLFALPASILLLVDATYHLGLGETVPWRQALIDTSWCRWEFWLFMTVCSFGLVPIVEELFYRGYCQRRLAEDWGDGPAIVGTALLLVFTHSQYLIPNAYNVATIAKVFLFVIASGVVFAWTRSLIPSMIAHAIINLPMTPRWEIIMLIALVVVGLFVMRRGLAVVKQVFSGATVIRCVALGIIGAAWALAAPRIDRLIIVATVMILTALGLGMQERWADRSGIHEAPLK